MTAAFAAGLVGCAEVRHTPGPRSLQKAPDAQKTIDGRVTAAVFQTPELEHPQPGMAATSHTAVVPFELAGPQPVDAFIRRALAENRTVQAAYHNVQSLRHRIPQVTALDDPVASNTVFPIPSVAPQYYLMGYNPYNLTLAQQFPWFGTRKLRGEAAQRDVEIALAEFAAAQLDTVAAVKRAYYSLYASERTEEILTENRKILEDFRAIAQGRLATGGSQQDVIQSDVLINKLDQDLATNLQAIAAARAALSRQLHLPPDVQLQTSAGLSLAAVPAEMERLTSLAIAARPELQGRLAAIARDEKAVALARKRSYPNFTLGLTYMDMERTNAASPKTASGSPNVGLFVAFNLPVHQQKYRAGVCEAEERARADTKLYEAQWDETQSEIQDLLVQAKVQQNVLSLLRDGILPRTKQSLDLAKGDYAKSNVDYATVLSALRELLQVQIQIAQVEAELGKALASLERAVGSQINDSHRHPAS